MTLVLRRAAKSPTKVAFAGLLTLMFYYSHIAYLLTLKTLKATEKYINFTLNSTNTKSGVIVNIWILVNKNK